MTTIYSDINLSQINQKIKRLKSKKDSYIDLEPYEEWKLIMLQEIDKTVIMTDPNQKYYKFTIKANKNNEWINKLVKELEDIHIFISYKCIDAGPLDPTNISYKVKIYSREYHEKKMNSFKFKLKRKFSLSE